MVEARKTNDDPANFLYLFILKNHIIPLPNYLPQQILNVPLE